MTTLFSQIWHAGLTAGFVVLAVLVLRLCCRKAPRWIAVALWALVAVRLLVPVTLTSPVSVVPPLPQTVVFDAPAQETPEDTTFESVVDTVPSETVNEPPVVIPETPRAALSLETVAAIVWVAGMVAMVTYMLVSTARLRRRVRTATKLEGRLYQSEGVTSPFILGVLNPKIYLPYGLDAAVQESVVAHETAHIKRGDHLIKPFAFLLLCVYWFQPLLWVAYVCLCRDIEAACDEKAIKALGDDARKEYSYALVTLGAKDRRRMAACPLAFGEVGVKDRVKRVMSYKKPTVWILTGAILLSLGASVCLLTNRAPKEGGATLEGATLHLRSKELNTQYKRTRMNDVPVEEGRRSAVRDHSDEAFGLQIARVDDRDMSVTVDLYRDVLIDGHKTDRVKVGCDEDVVMRSVDGGAEYTLSLNVEESEKPTLDLVSLLSYEENKKTLYGKGKMSLTLLDDTYFVWKINGASYGGVYTQTDDTLTLIEDGRLSLTVFRIDKTNGMLRYNKIASYRHKRSSFPSVLADAAMVFCYNYEIEEKSEGLYESTVKQFDGTPIYTMENVGMRPQFAWVGDGYISMRLTTEVEEGVFRVGQKFIHVATGETSEYYNEVVYAAEDVVAGLWEENGQCGVYVAQATYCGNLPLPEKHQFVLDNVDSLVDARVEAYADQQDLIVTYKDRDGQSRIVAYDWKNEMPLERAVIPTEVHKTVQFDNAFVSVPYLYATPVLRDKYTTPHNVLTDVYMGDGRTLHFIGVAKAAVYLDGEYVDLRTALQRGRLTLDGLIEMIAGDTVAGRASFRKVNKDDDTVEYRYGINPHNTVTVMDTVDGDRDIYIGPMSAVKYDGAK
ncbi:MAG: M56 family metallopeptidase [Clostridia bacterium]|nr:M56 family metallopeptidase [Clostridia bacterium]